jgi:hypothetical protein
LLQRLTAEITFANAFAVSGDAFAPPPEQFQSKIALAGILLLSVLGRDGNGAFAP